MENSTKNKKKKRGFTLVELVIVLAVMGIIALIAIPSLAGTKENFKIKADKKSCETIKRAVDILIADETIPEDTTGDISATYSKSSPNWTIDVTALKLTETDKTKSAAITSDIEKAIKNELQDNKGPQENGRTKYVITITSGKASVKTGS